MSKEETKKLVKQFNEAIEEIKKISDEKVKEAEKAILFLKLLSQNGNKMQKN